MFILGYGVKHFVENFAGHLYKIPAHVLISHIAPFYEPELCLGAVSHGKLQVSLLQRLVGVDFRICLIGVLELPGAELRDKRCLLYTS